MREGRWRLLGMRLESLLQHAQRRCRIVGKAEQFQVFGTDRAVPHQRVEVDDLVPVLRSVEQHRNRAIQFLRLLQREYLHHFVERAEPARKHDQRPREMREPQLAHKKIVKLERQRARDVRIGPLLMRQPDVQPDGPAARVGGAAIGRFHDTGAAAGADHVAVTVRSKALRPLRDQPRELAGLIVIAPERTFGRNPRRAEEHDRLVYLLAAKDSKRLEIFCKNPDRTSFLAVEKLLVLVSERWNGRQCQRIRLARFHYFPTRAKSTKPRSTSVSTSLTATWSPTSRPLNPRTTLPSAAG